MDYTLNFGAVFRGLDNLLAGLLLGLEMGLAGLLIGSVIGILAALAAVYGGRPARILVTTYVGLVRNVPILVLALFAFFALPQIGIRFSNVVTFAAVLAVYAGAYLTESFRAAILVIPKGITEAAASIGLTRTGTAIWVILPIALRNALPSVGNNFISLFKDTRAHLPGPEDQQRELPHHRGLDRREPDVCRHLCAPRCRAAWPRAALPEVLRAPCSRSPRCSTFPPDFSFGASRSPSRSRSRRSSRAR